MIRHEIEKKYIENGLNDFRLRTIEDIKLCHGIDIEAVKGYEELTEENKAIYRNAMLNIYNAWGIGNRSNLIPLRVYWAEEFDYLLPKVSDDGEEYNLVVGGVVKAITKDGHKKQVKKYWLYDDEELKEYGDKEKIFIEGPERYLRFEYKHGKRREWLHLINNGEDWY